MKIIKLPRKEFYDEDKNEFIYVEQGELVINHSLNSLRLWESIHHKPFLNREEKTKEEVIDYIRCMTINTVSSDVYNNLPTSVLNQIKEYIDDPQTATTIRRENQKRNNEIITAEIIYYWMVELQIPFECQHWHLNQLMMLIEVCSIKKQPPKKMSQAEKMAAHRKRKAAARSRRKK